jgi:glycosyltransferase involved in cell wall biosynthesis
MPECAVSVIVPVYNRRDVLARAVGSLLQQDFALPYEVVVVDDGSTDGTAEVVRGIDPRVRVIRQPNRGASAARYTGIKAARVGVVAFLDSDDVAMPSHLRLLWEGLHRRPDVVLAYARVADLEGRPFAEERLPSDVDGDGVLSDPLVNLLTVGCFTASMNLMTYREIALGASRGRGRVVASNDYDFCLRVATRGPFAFVNAFTIRCDRRADGISRTRRALQVAFAVLAAEDAVRLSGRRDPAVRAALRYRIELAWPAASVQTALERRFRLCGQVALVGLRRGRWLEGARRLWWALDSHLRPQPHRNGTGTAPSAT